MKYLNKMRIKNSKFSGIADVLYFVAEFGPSDPLFYIQSFQMTEYFNPERALSARPSVCLCVCVSVCLSGLITSTIFGRF